jgi:hypothetical protein
LNAITNHFSQSEEFGNSSNRDTGFKAGIDKKFILLL